MLQSEAGKPVMANTAKTLFNDDMLPDSNMEPDLGAAQKEFENSGSGTIPKSSAEQRQQQQQQAEPEVEQQSQAQVQQQAPAAPQPVSLTKEAIQEMLQQVAKPQQQQQEPQMTQEELARMLNVFNADQGLLETLGLKPEALPVFNNMLQAVVRQAVTMATVHQQQQMRAMMERFAPLQQFVSQQQEEKYRKEFFESNADLKGFEPLAEAIYTQMIQEKFSGTKEKVFEEIAKRTRDLKAKLNIPQATQQQQQSAPQTPRKMSTLTRGGQVGAGSNGVSTDGKNKTAVRLFS